jgi:hypothetical protein
MAANQRPILLRRTSSELSLSDGNGLDQIKSFPNDHLDLIWCHDIATKLNAISKPTSSIDRDNYKSECLTILQRISILFEGHQPLSGSANLNRNESFIDIKDRSFSTLSHSFSTPLPTYDVADGTDGNGMIKSASVSVNAPSSSAISIPLNLCTTLAPSICLVLRTYSATPSHHDVAATALSVINAMASINDEWAQQCTSAGAITAVNAAMKQWPNNRILIGRSLQVCIYVWDICISVVVLLNS